MALGGLGAVHQLAARELLPQTRLQAKVQEQEQEQVQVQEQVQTCTPRIYPGQAEPHQLARYLAVTQ